MRSLAWARSSFEAWPFVTERSGHDLEDPMTAEQPDKPSTPTFRATLVRVLAIQVVALALLWLLQLRYGR
jgi:hypothetical protein